MRTEYDFSDGIKNPHTKQPKTTITIRLDVGTVDYFKNMAEQVNIPYQTLINSYLADCAAKNIKPKLLWNI
ncbi:MAG: BrnA antitoxin family protein [Candidatus Adiutrix sp.]